MKKRDRALKLKGYRRVSNSVEGAIHTVAVQKNKKHEPIGRIERWWVR